MYLAPLNYDRFFKKVFSHTHIAKAFLEDFLDVKIEEITLLERSHLLTNKSTKFEVDFRCKIAGSYIIVDMQQWYKPDVVKRFYVYHCAATALQLEDLPEKKVSNTKDKRAKDIDYRKVEPVLTLIWMVDDSLLFKENFTAYTSSPESALDFIHNTELWEKNDLDLLLLQRQIVLKALDNRHKDLDFLQKNRLIFMFQNNIVNDTKFTKYKRWFEFAEKTRNKHNDADDFKDFKNEAIFKEMMGIILENALDADDLKYIETEDENLELLNRFLEGVKDDMRDEVREEIREEVKEELREEVKEDYLVDGIQKALKRGKLSIEEIAEDFEVSLEFVLQIKADLPN